MLASRFCLGFVSFSARQSLGEIFANSNRWNLHIDVPYLRGLCQGSINIGTSGFGAAGSNCPKELQDVRSLLCSREPAEPVA